MPDTTKHPERRTPDNVPDKRMRAAKLVVELLPHEARHYPGAAGFLQSHNGAF